MKRVKSEKYFSEAEQELIRQAVQAAEADTSGEIATMVVDESDRYPEAELSAALFIATMVSLVLAVLTEHVTIWSYIPMAMLFFIPGRFLVQRFPRLKLPFAGRRRIAEEVHQRAVRAFFEKGLYRTRHETGVLIFMSMLERKVWILGDRGINERIDPTSWQVMAGELAEGLATGKGCDALCSVIAKCGTELSRHFPHHQGDANELPDQLLTDTPR